MSPVRRLLICALVAVPLLYAAVALTDIGEGWTIFIGVLLFAATFTTLDYVGYPTRPVPGEWLRRRITVNVVYLAIVAAIAMIAAQAVRP